MLVNTRKKQDASILIKSFQSTLITYYFIVCSFHTTADAMLIENVSIKPTFVDGALINDNLDAFENVYSHGKAIFEDGELHLSSTQNWFFTTKKRYRNFILEADVHMPDVSEYSNSGIIFRGQHAVTEKGRAIIGYQAEIDPSSRKWTGGLFDQGRRLWLHPQHTTRSKKDQDFIANYIDKWTEAQANAYVHGSWNTLKIVANNSEIKIFVNEVLTTHVIDQKDSEGFIGFQHHGSKQLRETGKTKNIVRFRNIRIQELEQE